MINDTAKKDDNNNSTSENYKKIFFLELFPKNLSSSSSSPSHPGRTRQPRKFLTKIHPSGTAFLAGLKLGTILSKKGFELGHGKIVSAHSFQVFGKIVNTATSLSYGDSSSTTFLLPIVNDSPPPEEEGENSSISSATDDVNKIPSLRKNTFHVTVVEKRSPTENDKKNIFDDVRDDDDDDIFQSSKNHSSNEIEKPVVVKKNVVIRGNLKLIRNDGHDDFLREHNKSVNEFNKIVKKRINSKF